MNRRVNDSLLPLVICLAAACVGGCVEGSKEKTFGAIAVSLTGGKAATEGIADDAFSDGAWSVAFDAVTVVLQDVDVGGATIEGPFAADLSLAAGDPPQFALQTVTDVATGAHDVRFHIAPGADGATTLGGVSDEEIAALDAADASVHIAGAVTNPGADGEDDSDDVVVGIDWYLPLDVDGCVVGGVDVQSEQTAKARIAFDVTRAFATTVSGDDPTLVFSPLQVLAGADAIIDNAELADALADTGVYVDADDEEDMLSYVTRTVAGSLGRFADGDGCRDR